MWEIKWIAYKNTEKQNMEWGKDQAKPNLAEKRLGSMFLDMLPKIKTFNSYLYLLYYKYINFWKMLRAKRLFMHSIKTIQIQRLS